MNKGTFLWMNLSGVIIRALSFQLHRKVEILWHCFEFCYLKVILNYCTYVKKNRMHFPHDFLILKVIHIGTLHIFTAYVFYLFLSPLWLPYLIYFSRIHSCDSCEYAMESLLKKKKNTDAQSTHFFLWQFLKIFIKPWIVLLWGKIQSKNVFSVTQINMFPPLFLGIFLKNVKVFPLMIKVHE